MENRSKKYIDESLFFFSIDANELMFFSSVLTWASFYISLSDL